MMQENLIINNESKLDKKKLLLGIAAFLLISALLVTTISLVKQRQEIRKEAAIPPSCVWEFDVLPEATCVEPPSLPTIEILNQTNFENPVYFHWQARGSCLDYQGSVSGFHSYFNRAEKIEEEKDDQVTDGAINWISGQVRVKDYLGPTTCETCLEDNATTCCLSDWVTQQVCVFCKNPDNLQLTQAECPDETYDGTKITWTDQSNYESGFNLYLVDQSPDPSVFSFLNRVGPNIQEYTDCDHAWGDYQYLITCYTDTCGGALTPTPPTGTPTATNTPTGTPTATSTPTSTATPTPVPTVTATPTGTGTPTATSTPTSTSAPTSTATPISTGTPTPTNTPTNTPTPTATLALTPPSAGPTATLRLTATPTLMTLQIQDQEPGFTLPTLGAILAGIALIIGSLIFLL